MIIAYLSYVFPYVWLFTLLTSLADAFIYPGVIIRYTGLNPILLYVAMGILGLVSLFTQSQKIKTISGGIYKMSSAALIVFAVGYIVFNFLEAVNYPNFVFSNFHIHPKELTTPLLLTLFTYFVLANFKYLRHARNLKIRGMVKLLSSLILCWIIFQNFIGLFGIVAKDIDFIIKYPAASYEQKMEMKLGKQFYDYVMFIKRNTPENSKILLPPFPRPLPAYPWPQTGNNIYMRYFLYPRVLLNGEEYTPKYDLVKEKIDYVLIAWGETQTTSGNYTHGWPKFDVRANKVIYMISETEIKEEAGNYIYKDVENKELWGIIEVKK